MRLALTAALVSLTFPALAADWRSDYAGNAYPPECQRDLASDAALMARVTVTHNAAGTWPKDLGGVTLTKLVTGKAFIVLSGSYSGWKDAEHLQHELCHALFVLAGRDPNWHQPPRR